MALAHEAGADAHDPRLAFVASAENGLTRGTIRSRMRVAFGIAHDLAEALDALRKAAFGDEIEIIEHDIAYEVVVEEQRPRVRIVKSGEEKPEQKIIEIPEKRSRTSD